MQSAGPTVAPHPGATGEEQTESRMMKAGAVRENEPPTQTCIAGSRHPQGSLNARGLTLKLLALLLWNCCLYTGSCGIPRETASPCPWSIFPSDFPEGHRSLRRRCGSLLMDKPRWGWRGWSLGSQRVPLSTNDVTTISPIAALLFRGTRLDESNLLDTRFLHPQLEGVRRDGAQGYF